MNHLPVARPKVGSPEILAAAEEADPEGLFNQMDIQIADQIDHFSGSAEKLIGDAVISHLANILARADSPNGGHLVNGEIDLVSSDFDNIENERLYLTGDNAASIADL